MESIPLINQTLERLLKKIGGWYLVVATFTAVAVASITTLFGIIFERLNADYTDKTTALLERIELVAIPLLMIVLIATVLFLTRRIFASLNSWKNNPALFNNQNTEEAWRAAQNIIWKYAIVATVLYTFIIVIPKTAILIGSGYATRDQVIYNIIASIITNLAFMPLSAVIIDRFMVPVRNLLLPKDFSTQISGLSKLRILYKILAVVFISLLITALLIAPIGYHQTTRVLYEEVGSIQVLADLQVQSILVSGFAILFALSLAFLFSRSISDPLQELLVSFQKVENGDLSTRVAVVSSDEISKLGVYFNRMISQLQDLQSGLEKMVEERTSQLKAINEVGRAATSTLDPDELIRRVVALITEEFGYYFAAIYLIDQTKKWAELKDATGEAGKVLKESGHHFEIDRSNNIGKTLLSRQAQISKKTGERSTHPDNLLLPYTRSELSLPLFVGNQILGALDVHSTNENAFNEQDIETLQNMANQVAISLDNARLFQETRQRLNEMRNIQKQYLREAWIDSSYVQEGMTFAVGEAFGNSEEKNVVEVPISLRDQIIGQLHLEGNEPLSAEEQNWIQAIATQAALALENARLLEESQSAAMREKFVTEITNKIWASTSINSVLQTTLRELGQILDASEATIEINIDEN